MKYTAPLGTIHYPLPTIHRLVKELLGPHTGCASEGTQQRPPRTLQSYRA